MTSSEAERRVIQALYCRICRDSRFQLDYVRAAVLIGQILSVHPLEVWIAMSSFDLMEKIAAGSHPAAHRDPLYPREEMALSSPPGDGGRG